MATIQALAEDLAEADDTAMAADQLRSPDHSAEVLETRVDLVLLAPGWAAVAVAPETMA